eukprot:gene44556-55439_t
MDNVAKYCPKLRRLDVDIDSESCGDLPRPSVDASPFVNVLTKCTDLLSLQVSDCFDRDFKFQFEKWEGFFGHNNNLVEDAVLQTIADNNCRTLSTFDFECGRDATVVGLQY